MKIALVGRGTGIRQAGGDLAQVQKTEEGLRNLGHEVTTVLGASCDYPPVDVVHVFGSLNPVEVVEQVRCARGKSTYVVWSPIYYSKPLIHRYKSMGRGVGSYLVENTVGHLPFWRTLEVNVADALISRKAPPVWKVLRSYTRLQRSIVRGIDAVIVNSATEREWFLREIGEDVPVVIVPNGIDVRVSSDNKRKNRELKDYTVVSVGRVEPVKNQIALAKALIRLKRTGLFIGAINPKHPVYARRFLSLVRRNANLKYSGPKSHSEVMSLFARDDVIVAVPSWFETTSLVGLEAESRGAPLVMTSSGYTRDYFSGAATFCDPASIEDIMHAIENADSGSQVAERDAGQPYRVAWPSVARQIEQVYMTLRSAGANC